MKAILLALMVIAQPCFADTYTGNQVYDSFMKSVSTTNESTIDGFLKQLKQNSTLNQAGMTKSLFYNSRSRHGSSFESPRAVVMYGQGDLILTFNGDASQDFYQSLEVVGYNPSRARFEFRDIVFKNEKSGNSKDSAVKSSTDLEIESSVVKIRSGNSTSCAECHGFVSQRPLWLPYLAWEGAYGSYEESFALNEPRFAMESKNLELNNLALFNNNASNLPRYRWFDWRGLKLNNTRMGIRLNYKMANMAMQLSMRALAEPQKNKFKYAFAGYLLGCEQEFIPKNHAGSYKNDSLKGLQNLVQTLFTKRVQFETRARQNITANLTNAGETLTWVYPIKSLAQSSAKTTREDSVLKLAKMENLFNAIKLSPEYLYLDGGKSSWDGYNEIIDYMSDYLLKYYKLSPITEVHQKQAEQTKNIPHRSDLVVKLSQSDYNTVSKTIEQLQLPKMPNGGQKDLCKSLATLSQQGL